MIDKQIRFFRLPIVPMTRKRVNPARSHSPESKDEAHYEWRRDDDVGRKMNKRTRYTSSGPPVIRSSIILHISSGWFVHAFNKIRAPCFHFFPDGRLWHWERAPRCHDIPPTPFLKIFSFSKNTDMTDGMNVSETNQHAIKTLRRINCNRFSTMLHCHSPPSQIPEIKA